MCQPKMGRGRCFLVRGVEVRLEQKGVSIHFHCEPPVFFSAYILIELSFLLRSVFRH